MALLANIETLSGAPSTYQRIVSVVFDVRYDATKVWRITVEHYYSEEKRDAGAKPVETTVHEFHAAYLSPDPLAAFYTMLGASPTGAYSGASGDAAAVPVFTVTDPASVLIPPPP